MSQLYDANPASKRSRWLIPFPCPAFPRAFDSTEWYIGADARPHPARAEPSATRAADAPRARRVNAPASARTDGRASSAVRAIDVRRPMGARRRLRARPPPPPAPAAPRRTGLDDADDDPPRFEEGLLAVRRRDS